MFDVPEEGQILEEVSFTDYTKCKHVDDEEAHRKRRLWRTGISGLKQSQITSIDRVVRLPWGIRTISLAQSFGFSRIDYSAGSILEAFNDFIHSCVGLSSSGTSITTFGLLMRKSDALFQAWMLGESSFKDFESQATKFSNKFWNVALAAYFVYDVPNRMLIGTSVYNESEAIDITELAQVNSWVRLGPDLIQLDVSAYPSDISHSRYLERMQELMEDGWLKIDPIKVSRIVCTDRRLEAN